MGKQEPTLESETESADLPPDNPVESADLPLDNPLDSYLDALYEKRGSTREKALSSFIEALKKNLQHEFVENNFFTLLHRYFHSMKVGSAKEISLACHAIGLLALATDCKDKQQKLFEESLGPLSRALESCSDVSITSHIFKCLAVIIFVGGNDEEEVERATEMIWQFIQQQPGSINLVVQNPSAALITTATSAWSFILTTMVGRGLNSKGWQEAVSHFSSLLEKKDRSVRVAAGEALALLYEIGCPKMYSDDDAIKQLKRKILKQVLGLSTEAGGRGTRGKKALNYQHSFFRDVRKFLKVGIHPETSKKIGRGLLKTSTWSKLIQLKFLMPFLGDGFLNHMQENKMIRALFEYTPIEELSSDEKLKKLQTAASHKIKYLERMNERDTVRMKKTALFAVW